MDDAPRPAGPFTIHHAAQRRDELTKLVDAGATRVDLSAIDECDAAGVQLLLAARRSAHACGRRLPFDAPSAAATEALRRCGVALED